MRDQKFIEDLLPHSQVFGEVVNNMQHLRSHIPHIILPHEEVEPHDTLLLLIPEKQEQGMGSLEWMNEAREYITGHVGSGNATVYEFPLSKAKGMLELLKREHFGVMRLQDIDAAIEAVRQRVVGKYESRQSDGRSGPGDDEGWVVN